MTSTGVREARRLGSAKADAMVYVAAVLKWMRGDKTGKDPYDLAQAAEAAGVRWMLVMNEVNMELANDLVLEVASKDGEHKDGSDPGRSGTGEDGSQAEAGDSQSSEPGEEEPRFGVW